MGEAELMLDHIRTHFDLSYDMLLNQIEICPDTLWDDRVSGFVFWQQILHVLAGVDFWTRSEQGDFKEPFKSRKVYPELEKAPMGFISRREMRIYAGEVYSQVESLFEEKNDPWLLEKNPLYNKISNIDVIEMQIRHIQYHIGHCDASLRERNFSPSEWFDFQGKENDGED